MKAASFALNFVPFGPGISQVLLKGFLQGFLSSGGDLQMTVEGMLGSYLPGGAIGQLALEGGRVKLSGGRFADGLKGAAQSMALGALRGQFVGALQQSVSSLKQQQAGTGDETAEVSGVAESDTENGASSSSQAATAVSVPLSDGGQDVVTITVIIKKEDPNAQGKLGRKGLSGHAGILVGDEYYDYGPIDGLGGDELFGEGGGPFWDGDDKNAIFEFDPNSEVPVPVPVTFDGDLQRGELRRYLAGRSINVAVFTLDVTRAQANSVSAYWDKLYAASASDGTKYHFAGRQCTSTVAKSLRQADIGAFRALRPSSLAEAVTGS